MPYDYDPTDPDAPQPMDIARSQADDDGEDELIACTGCGRYLDARAALCPHCGEWVLDDSPARQRSRGWFWPLMVGLLVAMILVMWAGLR